MDENSPSIEPNQPPGFMGPPGGLSDSENPKIGGWLAFFCFVQIIVAPLFVIVGGGWALWESLHIADAYPVLVLLVVLSFLGTVAVTGFGVYATLLVYRVRPGAVRRVKQYLVAALVWTFLDRGVLSLGSLGISNLYPDLRDGIPKILVGHEFKDLIRAFLRVGIWYTYFSVSKRVKATFPTGIKPIPETQRIDSVARVVLPLAVILTIFCAVFRDTPVDYNSRGIEAHKKRDLNGAITNFTEAIKLAPTAPDGYYFRGNARIDKGDLDGAIADYTKAIDLKSDVAKGYYQRGLAEKAKRDFDSAIKDFSTAIDLKPDYPLAYHQRALAKEAKLDLDGAIADFTKGIDLRPDDGSAYNNRGNAKRAKSDFAGAVADYTKAIGLRPGLAEAYFNRGVSRGTEEDFDGAIADFTKAIDLKPGDAAAYDFRSGAKRMNGDLDGALADATKAIELKPDLVLAYINRGTAKVDSGDLDGATADFLKAIELKPDSAGAYNCRAFLNQMKADLSGAMADFNKSIELQPNWAEPRRNRGCLRFDSHQYADALVDFRKAIDLDSSDGYSELRIWFIRARAGEVQDATKELQIFMTARAKRKADDWVVTIGHFLVNQIPEPEFLSAAENADPKTRAVMTCEAYFYAGSKHLLAGHNSIATNYFQKSIATGKKSLNEYISAMAELRILRSQPD